MIYYFIFLATIFIVCCVISTLCIYWLHVNIRNFLEMYWNEYIILDLKNLPNKQ